MHQRSAQKSLGQNLTMDRRKGSALPSLAGKNDSMQANNQPLPKGSQMGERQTETDNSRFSNYPDGRSSSIENRRRVINMPPSESS